MANCELCGKPMPEGEEMFKYHGYSGPCPVNPDDKKIATDQKSNVTIHLSDIVQRICEHCGTETLHIGMDGNTCLQCIADQDLAGCCTIKMFNRWRDADGKALVEPRGSAL